MPAEIQELLQSPAQIRAAIDHLKKRAAERSFYEFFKQAWHVIEPETPFKDGWHLELMCRHAQAVTLGKIKRLLVNLPPAHCKSILWGVAWIAWTWIHKPWFKFLCASYAEELALRDSIRCRNLIRSAWYQERWGSIYSIAEDQDTKGRFNIILPGGMAGGWRIAAGTSGRGVGEHPDAVLGDDLHNVRKAESIIELEGVVRKWYSGMISSRGVIRDAARVFVGQRVADEDIFGYAKKQADASGKLLWESICLPLEYEGADVMLPTSLGMRDRRTKIDELLWPAAFSHTAVETLKSDMDQAPGAVAGQLQQRPPAHAEGAAWPYTYFEGEDLWFDEWPDPSRVVVKVCTLDPSLGRTENSDYQAFVKLATAAGGLMYVEAHLLRTDEVGMAENVVGYDQDFCPSSFGIESNGFQSLLFKPIADLSVKHGVMVPIVPMNNTEKKEIRIRRVGPYLNARQFRFRRTPGTRLLVRQLKQFPGGEHDDGPDALEMALRLTRGELLNRRTRAQAGA